MRALVVYESVAGSTRELAEAIADGLRGTLDADTVRADRVQSRGPTDAELLVAGGPTHAGHGGPAAPAGPKKWFEALHAVPPLFAAFDTRAAVPQLLTGAASVRIGKELRRRGSTPVVPPESFLVTTSEALLPGEAERGRAWGELVAAAALRAGSRRTTA